MMNRGYKKENFFLFIIIKLKKKKKNEKKNCMKNDKFHIF